MMNWNTTLGEIFNKENLETAKEDLKDIAGTEETIEAVTWGFAESLIEGLSNVTEIVCETIGEHIF